MTTRAKKGEPKKADKIKADILLQKWLESIGGVKGPHGTPAHPSMGWDIECPEYYIETKLGRLRVHPSSSHGGCYTCFTCFDEPKRAAAVIGRHNMNDYSGKWNFHHFENDATPEDFAGYVSGEICDLCGLDKLPIMPTHDIETAGRQGMQIVPGVNKSPRVVTLRQQWLLLAGNAKAKQDEKAGVA